MNQLHVGDTLHGFILKSISDLKEYKGKGYMFGHEKTGLELFHLNNDDEDNLFSFVFKTPVSSDTGVAHILEHSVLSGSKNYPVKDPFMSLIKGSMNTFINAMTYPDKTVYPASSPVEKDYFNIMGVYADAVFFPLLKKEVFQQEGHRLEFDEDGNLRIVGVVYNEMKGAYSNHDSIAAEWSVRSLFPDTQYTYNSGGEPLNIPDLTYEEFLDFHKTYYHPSNCRVFLYGNIPVEKQLRFLQEKYLSGFSRRDINPVIKKQKRWMKKRSFDVTSALAEGESAEHKSTVLINYLTTDVSDPYQMLILQAVSEILLGNEGAPLYKAIIESGLGSDLSPVSGLETDLQEFVFSVGIRGTDPDKKEAFEKLVYDELQKLVRNGIHKDNVTGALKRMEFHNREIKGGAPSGLRYMDKALRGWLHGYTPESTLEFSRWMEKLKTAVAQDTTFFEKFIKKTFLDNTHRSIITVRPDKDHTKKQNRAEAEKIQEIMKVLTPEWEEQILNDNEKLNNFQKIPDSPEALATIPQLSLEDLPRDISIIKTIYQADHNLSVYRHDLFTNGIVYADFSFNAGMLTDEETMYLPLFGKMITSASLPGIPYDEVARLFSLYTGGFYSFLESSSVLGKKVEFRNSIFFRLKFLEEDRGKAIELLMKMFLHAKIDEESRLKDVIFEMKGDFSASFIPSGHSYSTLRAGSKLKPVFNYEEKWRGIDQYLFLYNFTRDLTQEKLHDIGKMLQKIREKLLCKETAEVNISAPENVIDATLSHLLPEMSTLYHSQDLLDHTLLKKVSYTKAESVYIPAPVGFVGLALEGSGIESKDHAAEILLSHILKTEYLWEAIRMKGGAYGASASANGMEGVFSFSSYRDPKILDTIEAYREGLQYYSDTLLDEEKLTQAVIAVVGKDVRPLAPGEKSIIGFRRALYGITDRIRRDKRHWLLAVSPRDIQTASKHLLENFNSSALVVLAGRENIEAAAKKSSLLPGTVIPLPQ